MKKDFITLGVSTRYVELLKKNGITEPTPIQEKAIPSLLQGKDLIGQAQTGTGKTLAFLLPIVESIDVEQDYTQALILTPTRELALQITKECKKLVENTDIKVLAAYGGQDVEGQIHKLKKAVHIVVATPGRLLDHLRRGTVRFHKLSKLVLDEADQMLDMGFLVEVEQIISQAPKKRQTMLFSATMPQKILSLTKKYMNHPEWVQIKSQNITLDDIKQTVIETTDRKKQDALVHMLRETMPYLAVVFCRTKRRAKTLNEALITQGFSSDELHGDLTQAKRERVMEKFRKARIQLLIATDVAARGLDIEGVTHVFNYDIPHDAESYIHRIGRTGRAGEQGVAITFVTPKDRDTLRLIEKGIQKTLKKESYGTDEGFESIDSGKPRGKEQDRRGPKEGNRKGYREKDNSQRGPKGKGGHRSGAQKSSHQERNHKKGGPGTPKGKTSGRHKKSYN